MNDIPIVIVAYNQLTYIRNMVFQCLPLTKKIYIIDNKSTYEPLLSWYKEETPKFKSIELIRNKGNEGHLTWKKYISRFPDEYIITDPDLYFNPKMPPNSIDILSNIGKKYNAEIIGLALDISDHNDFISKTAFGQTIYAWESKFWKNKINNTDDIDIYQAAIDTTFALRSKSRKNGKSLRVAGDFTSKHMPWYTEDKSPIPISYEEKVAYLVNNKSNNYWDLNMVIPFESVKRNETVIKIDSSNINANWFKFMKNNYVNNWEKNTFDIIEVFSNPNKVLLDIGSWIGPISLYFADKFKYIYAIEPDKESVKILRRNISLNNFHNVIPIDKALHDKNVPIYFGPNEFHRNKEMNNSISQSREYKLYDNDYEVSGITLDELINRYKIENIGIIKCDIEGGEENIINDILSYSHKYHIPVWMSFHYNWWKRYKLENFENIFRLYFEDYKSVIENIKNNVLTSILFYK
jgi:FkbM family methyltransferase